MTGIFFFAVNPLLLFQSPLVRKLKYNDRMHTTLNELLSNRLPAPVSSENYRYSIITSSSRVDSDKESSVKKSSSTSTSHDSTSGDTSDTELHTPLLYVYEWPDFDTYVESNLKACDRFLSRSISSPAKKFENPVDTWYYEFVQSKTPQQLLLANVIDPIFESLGTTWIDIKLPTDGADSVVVLDPDIAVSYKKRSVWFCIICPTPEEVVQYENNDKSKLREKLFGLMTINNCTYGVISSYTKSWVVKRLDGVSICISDEISHQGTGIKSLISALVAVCKSCMEFERSMDDYAQEQQLTLPIRITSHDYMLARISSSTKYQSFEGNLVYGYLNDHSQPAIFKITKYDCTTLDNEYLVYEYMIGLQSDTVPKVLTVGNFWNLGKVMVFETVGPRLTVDELTIDMYHEMKDLVIKLHQCSVLHGNLRLSNFVHYGTGELRVVNYEKATINPSMAEKKQELERVDQLWTERNNDDYWLLWQ